MQQARMVKVPDQKTASRGEIHAAHALNKAAMMYAINSIRSVFTADNRCAATQHALIYSFLAFKHEMNENFAMAQKHGGLPLAWHGTKAFDGDVCHEHGDVTVQDAVKMMSYEYCKMLTHVIKQKNKNNNQTIGE